MTGVIFPTSRSPRRMAIASFLLGIGEPGPRSCFTKRERKISLRKWGTSPNTRLPDAPKRSCPMRTYLPLGLSARLQAESDLVSRDVEDEVIASTTLGEVL